MAKITIVSATHELITALPADLESNNQKHSKRLASQMAGLGQYLIILAANQPVGHLYLNWQGSQLEPMRSNLIDCPNIEDIKISNHWRRQGLAQKLLIQAETLSQCLGFKQIGLAVRLDNQPALTLYAKLGYQPVIWPQSNQSIILLAHPPDRRSILISYCLKIFN